MTSNEDPWRVRLDIWLDVACLFRTRSEARKACQLGRVEVDGHVAKPHRDLKAGNHVVILRPFGRRQHVVVKGVIGQHVAKAEARLLYDDVTPPPDPQEVEWRKLAALARPTPIPGVVPDRRSRREARRMKEGGSD